MRKYTLSRSKRKSLSIQIKKDGSLHVKAPIHLPQKEIDDFIDSKEKWIAKHTEEISKKYELKKEFSLNFDDFVLVRGEKAYIRPIEENMAKYDEKRRIFYINKDANSKIIKYMLIELYKRIAKNHILQRVAFFAKKMNVMPTNVRITNAKTRWGSCSGKNSINFPWRLIMAEDSAIDYVVVHELAHIKQKNHSPEFWKIVETIIHDYKKEKEKLKILSEKLSKENWD